MNLFIDKADKKLISEWCFEKNTDFNINEIAAVTSKKVWWKCSKGHEWQASVSHRMNGRGCPVCCGKKVLIGYNDLSTKFPDIAEEWDYEKNSDLTPQMVTPGSNKKVWWKCKNGHEWYVSINGRTHSNSKCPICRNREVKTGFNDLVTKYPEVAAEWDYKKNAPLSPENIRFNDSRKVWWKCSKGHEWQARIDGRISGRGCPKCATEKTRIALSTPKPNCSLADLYPDVASEWNYDKNELLLPDKVNPKSGKKVWWRCTKGHEWQATINHRVNGTGCPFCSGHKVLIGYNDLLSQNPTVADEWFYEKNGDLAPEMVTCNSNKIVWWKCKVCGKEWKSSVSDRNRGQGCPACAYIIRGQKKSTPSMGESLEDIGGEILTEWNYEKNTISPSMFYPSSNKIVWWKCLNGHEWKASINNRSSGTGCPYCSGRKVLIGFNDLVTQKPDLAKEWDYNKNGELIPEMFTSGSNKKVWWICKKGHEWNTSINSRTSNNSGCPVCSNLQILIGYNDLKTKYPELLDEWDYKKNKKDPSEYPTASKESVWWICKKGHEWKARIANRSILNRGCPICAKELRTSFPEQAVYYYINNFFNDAINGNRDILKGLELDIFIPSINVAVEYDGVAWHYADDTKKREVKKNKLCEKLGIKLIRIREEGLEPYDNCICIMRKDNTNEQDLVDSIYNVLKLLNILNPDIDLDRDRGYIQGGFELSEKNNSLEFLYPEIAKSWNYDKNGKLTPVMVTPGSNKRVWWICPKGHEWIVSVNNRVRVEGCPICNNVSFREGYNDLQTKYPEIALEWNYEKNSPLTPDKIKFNDLKKVWWICSKGHEWLSSPSNRCTNKKGCPVCALVRRGKKRSVPKAGNSLSELYPLIAAEWNYEKNMDITPSQISGGSNKKVWWKCKKGHEWEAKVTNRTYLGRGCPYCYGRYVISGETDLETVNPRLANEWNYKKNGNLKPSSILPSVNKKVWWICPNGHEWQATVNSRSRGCGCPICAGRKNTTIEADDD